MTCYADLCVAEAKTLFQCQIDSTSPNEFKGGFSHFLATLRATIRSVSEQPLRTAVYLEEFKMVMNGLKKTRSTRTSGRVWFRVLR